MELNYSFYQHYWWLLVALLGALLVFLLFVQGGQLLLLLLGKTESEKRMLLNSLGRKWELTYTTLVTFGGAFFASFPLFYSTSFGGAYWVWMAILFSFVLQAVSYEFRSKENNFLGAKTYEVFLLINGVVGPLLIGMAVGTFFTGAEFIVQKQNIIGGAGSLSISQWANPLHGLEAVFDGRNVLLGLVVVTLSTSLALLYFMNNISDDTLFARCKYWLRFSSMAFVLLFVLFVVTIFLSEGYSVNDVTGVVCKERYKYFWNFVDLPMVAVAFLAGVALVLTGLFKAIFKPCYKQGIWSVGIGSVLAVWMLLLNVGWNNTPYYPSSEDLQSSLTIANSSSSLFTLKVMSVVSLLIPFVLAYIVYAWRAIDRVPLGNDEIEKSSEAY